MVIIVGGVMRAHVTQPFSFSSVCDPKHGRHLFKKWSAFRGVDMCSVKHFVGKVVNHEWSGVKRIVFIQVQDICVCISMFLIKNI